MSENIFRPVEFWKSAMMTMPDNSFFELVRSVFGKIKTPFSKQQLVNDLEAFLLREDIQKTISCYIDENDSRVIAAVAALGEPAPGELESFFSGELNYASLADIVVNLEERFILYRFRDESQPVKVGRLALNPVLQEAIGHIAAEISVLFPSIPLTQTASGDLASPVTEAVLNDRILAGLLSFVSEDEVFFKSEGVLRKKTIENGKAIFPGIDLRTVFGSLQALGLFYIEGDKSADKFANEKLAVDYRRFEDFAALSPRRRMEYCAAAIICCSDTESPFGILQPLLRGRIQITAGFISRFLDTLKTELLYPEKTLKKLADVLLREKGVTAGRKNYDTEKLNKDKLLEALEKTGLIETVCSSGGQDSRQLKRLGIISAKGSAQLSSAAPSSAALSSASLSSVAPQTVSPDSPHIAADSDFSFLVYPEISFSDAIGMAQAFSIRQSSLAVRFEMTKDSAIRAFNRNISADSIIELLKRLSADRISETFVWTVKEWEKRYNEVSLRRGLVLSLSEDKRYIVQTKALAGIITETLAPGLYLIHENAQNEATAALAAAGIDIISQKESVQNKASGSKTAYNYFSSSFVSIADVYSSDYSAALQDNSKHCTPAAKTPEHCADDLIESFNAMLNKMSVGKAEKDELAARIRRRLILCENQLKDSDVRYEKLEARLLDYPGKVNIAKQALAQQSPVEIVWQERPQSCTQSLGQEARIFGIPKALSKEEGEQFLVIAPQDASGGAEDTVRIPLGKIILLRRIKKSIFEI